MIPKNKIFLTPEQDSYLCQNYPITDNETICEELGISERTVTRLARERGLVKDMSVIDEKRRKKISVSVRRAFLLMGGNDHNENGVKTRFKFGFKPLEAFGEEKFWEMHRKAVETRKRRFAEERARVNFGLPPRTRMRVIRQPSQKIQDRSYLKKRGYILDEKNNIAYYTEETRRAVRLEARPRRFYIFKPYEQHQ